MGRRWFGCFSLLVLGISGCWWDDLTSGSKNVVSNRSNVPPIEVLQKAPNDVGSRVDSLGKQILAANQDIGRTLVTADPQLQKAAAAKQDFRPVFFAYGVPDVVLFHQGFSAIVISDGLVRQCKSDSELAAVLSSELAAMVAEAQAQISARRQEIPDRQLAGQVLHDRARQKLCTGRRRRLCAGRRRQGCALGSAWPGQSHLQPIGQLASRRYPQNLGFASVGCLPISDDDLCVNAFRSTCLKWSEYAWNSMSKSLPISGEVAASFSILSSSAFRSTGFGRVRMNAPRLY